MATTIGERNKPTPTGRRRGHWIPWVFVGLFLLVLAVNGTMITIAISTFNGLETTNAYEKGLAYNDRLAAAAEQERLGWETSLNAVPNENGQVTLTFVLADRLGAPIAAADVRARIDRPLQAGRDQVVVLEATDDGRYAATVDLPLKGQWNVQLTAEARGERYQLAKRIHIAP
ncbi:MAG: FixH family protein [Alphaproteobacteria bacterium]|nr:FixH family protein [Alphaproteobacteria bacterium]